MNLKKILLGIMISIVMTEASFYAKEPEEQRSQELISQNKAEQRSQMLTSQTKTEPPQKKSPAETASPQTPKTPSGMSDYFGRKIEFVMATTPYMALLATTAMQPVSAFMNYDWRPSTYASKILGASYSNPVTDVLIVPCLDLFLTCQKERNQNFYPNTSFETSGKATALTMVLSVLSARSAWEFLGGKSIMTTYTNGFFSIFLCGWTWYSATAKYKSFLENFLHYTIAPVISSFYRSMMGKDPYSSY